MRVKNILIYSAIFLIVLMCLQSVLAITGSIGNSRMVLRLDPGESVQKYVLVKNVNNVSLNIELFVSGDLEKSVELDDKNFTLNPGEEKKVYFTIKATKPGTTETKIQIKFTPEEGSAVGLSATVVVISDKNAKSTYDDNNTLNSMYNETNSSSDGFNFNPKGIGNAVKDIGGTFSPLIILSILTFILIIVLIFLFVYAHKRRQKKSVPDDGITKLKKKVSRYE